MIENLLFYIGKLVIYQVLEPRT